MRSSGGRRFRYLPLILEREREGKPYVGLISRLPQRRDIPNEEGQWMEFRHLNRRQLAEAANERTYRLSDAMERIGQRYQDMLNEVSAAARVPDAEPAPYDPLNSFDLDTLLNMGIAAWSYVYKDGKDKGKAIPVNDDEIAYLEPETAEWAAREILAICNVARPDEAKENRKNS